MLIGCSIQSAQSGWEHGCKMILLLLLLGWNIRHQSQSDCSIDGSCKTSSPSKPRRAALWLHAPTEKTKHTISKANPFNNQQAATLLQSMPLATKSKTNTVHESQATLTQASGPAPRAKGPRDRPHVHSLACRPLSQGKL